jgi:hypothetical protein
VGSLGTDACEGDVHVWAVLVWKGVAHDLSLRDRLL